MRDSDPAQRFDALAAQIHEWVESAVALDRGHFPSELLSDLDDLLEDLKQFLDEEGDDYNRADVLELFVTPEMAEVVQRFPRVKRTMERAWGPDLTELLEEEAEGFVPPGDEEDDE